MYCKQICSNFNVLFQTNIAMCILEGVQPFFTSFVYWDLPFSDITELSDYGISYQVKVSIWWELLNIININKCEWIWINVNK